GDRVRRDRGDPVRRTDAVHRARRPGRDRDHGRPAPPAGDRRSRGPTAPDRRRVPDPGPGLDRPTGARAHDHTRTRARRATPLARPPPGWSRAPVHTPPARRSTTPALARTLDPMPHTMRDYLASLSEEELASIIDNAADAGAPIRSLDELAQRLQHPGTVVRALQSGPLPRIQLLEAVTALGLTLDPVS